MTMMEKRQSVLQESAFQLPPDTPIEFVDPPEDAGFQILTDTLDQTLGQRPGTYCRGMRMPRLREPRVSSSSQSKGEVTTLTEEVASLRSKLASYKSQISLIIKALSESGIHLRMFVPGRCLSPSNSSMPRTPPLQPLACPHPRGLLAPRFPAACKRQPRRLFHFLFLFFYSFTF